jgi:hypothetical protein
VLNECHPIAPDRQQADAAALAGVGITRLLSYQVAEPLETGELTRPLTSYEPAAVPVSL